MHYEMYYKQDKFFFITRGLDIIYIYPNDYVLTEYDIKSSSNFKSSFCYYAERYEYQNLIKAILSWDNNKKTLISKYSHSKKNSFTLENIIEVEIIEQDPLLNKFYMTLPSYSNPGEKIVVASRMYFDIRPGFIFLKGSNDVGSKYKSTCEFSSPRTILLALETFRIIELMNKYSFPEFIFLTVCKRIYK